MKSIDDLLQSQTAANNTIGYFLLQNQMGFSATAAFLKIYNFQRSLWEEDTKEWLFGVNGWKIQLFFKTDVYETYDEVHALYTLYVHLTENNTLHTRKNILLRSWFGLDQQFTLRKQEKAVKELLFQLLEELHLLE